MNDPAVALAVASAIEANTAFAGLNIYAHFERIVDGVASPAEEIEFPCILIESKSQPLASSGSFATAAVQIIVETQSDDEATAIHNARSAAIVAAFSSYEPITAAFTARGLQLLGRPALTASDPDIEHRALRAVFTYKLGYAS